MTKDLALKKELFIRKATPEKVMFSGVAYFFIVDFALIDPERRLTLFAEWETAVLYLME